MKLQTKHFGQIEILPEAIITFEEGLPGFEDIKQYALLPNPDAENPFQWLQAIEEPELAFVITNPFYFKEDYEFNIPEKVIQQLQIEKKEEILVYTIAVVPEKLEDITINLRGPLILNMEQKKGRQLLLDQEDYALKYKIFQKLPVEPKE
ncbi:MAG: flagellar assembly protein FliW [Thermotaleaceae bacterium]